MKDVLENVEEYNFIIEENCEEILDKLTKWAQEHKYLDEYGQNIGTLSEKATLEMLRDLENYISKIDEANGYKYSRVPDGRTIIPYTSSYGNIDAWKLADNISKSTTSYSYVSDTAVGMLSMNPEFETLLHKITGNSDEQYIGYLLWGIEKEGIKSKDPMLNIGEIASELNGEIPVSFVDYLSQRVMSQEIGNARGNVIALVSNSENNNVFIRTEFMTLLNNTDVESINGVSRTQLLNDYNVLRQKGIGEYDALYEIFQPVKENCDKYLSKANIYVDSATGKIQLDLSHCDELGLPVNNAIPQNAKLYSFDEYMEVAKVLDKEILSNGSLEFINDKGYFSRQITDVDSRTVIEFMEGSSISQSHQGELGFKYADYINTRNNVNRLLNATDDVNSFAVKIGIDEAFDCLKNGMTQTTLSKYGIMSDADLKAKYSFLTDYTDVELNAYRGYEYLIASRSSDDAIRKAGFLADADLKKKYSFLEDCTDADIFNSFRSYEYFLPSGNTPSNISNARVFLDRDGKILKMSDFKDVDLPLGTYYEASVFDLTQYSSITDDMLRSKLGSEFDNLNNSDAWVMKEYFFLESFVDEILDSSVDTIVREKYLLGSHKSIEELNVIDDIIIKFSSLMGDQSKRFETIANFFYKYPVIGKTLKIAGNGLDIFAAGVIICNAGQQAIYAYVEGNEDYIVPIITSAYVGWAVDVVGGYVGGETITAALAPYFSGLGMAIGGAPGAAAGAVIAAIIGYGAAGIVSSKLGEFISESWRDIYEFINDPEAKIEEEMQEFYGRLLSVFDPDVDGAYFKGTDKDDYLVGGYGDNTMEGLDGNDKIFGLDGNDEIYGGKGNDALYGQSGDDILYGESGDDILSGGAGDDILYGGTGDDTYIWGRNCGNDCIYDIDGVNTIKFTDLFPSDLRVVYVDYSDAYVIIKDTGEILYFPEFAKYLPYYRNYKLEFADGQVISIDSPLSPFISGIEGDENDNLLYGYFKDITITGNAGNDVLIGTEGNDVLIGGEGDDSLQGLGGDDTLIGGPGSDYLEGGSGDDLYIISAGDGNDTIDDYSGVTTIDLKNISLDELIVLVVDTDNAVLLSQTHDNMIFIKSFRKRNPEKLMLLFNGTDGIHAGDPTSPFLHLYGSDEGETIYAFFENGSVYGFGGDDLIYGTNGQDEIYGMDGDDSLHGNSGDDYLDGGEGDDYINGGYGNDTIDGGSGNDEIYGDAGDDILNGGAGDDRLEGGVGDDTYVYGVGYGNDVIYDSNGTNKLKFVEVKPSDLSVSYPSGSNDAVLTITATGETLTIEKFRYMAGFRNLVLEFDDGTEMPVNDVRSPFLNVVGTDFDDTVNVYYGNSVVHALAGDDTVNGCDGNDTIYAGDGDDIVYGNKGDDIIDGGTGDDRLEGGDGNDTYVYGIGYGNDVIYDSNGTNKLKLVGLKPSDLTVSYPSGNNNAVLTITATGETLTIEKFRYMAVFRNIVLEFDDGTEMPVNDVRSPFLNVVGTDSDDTVNVYYGNSVVRALAGDDIVNGSDGNDTIYAGDGDDIVYGNKGDDIIYGGAGDDTISGNAGNDVIYGGDGNDIISGSTGDDFIDGGAGNDDLSGGDGNDTYIYGFGYGNDVITDSFGTNRIKFVGVAPSDLSVFYSSDNNNAVLTVIPTGETLTITSFRWSAGHQNFTLEFDDGTEMKINGEGSPFRNVVGTESGEKIIAYYANSTIHALGGDDEVSGTSGNDVIYGGDGNDTISGSTGNDVIDGGTGNDTLKGGDGNDTYIYGVGYGNDTVTDNFGTNRIKLVGVTPSDISVLYPSDSNNAVLQIESTGENLTLVSFRYSSSYRNFTLEFDDGTTGKIDYNSGTIILNNSDGTDATDIAALSADYLGEKVIQASADTLSALYEGYDLTSKLFDGINNYVTTVNDVTEKAPIEDKREIIDYRTNIQAMILAENMAVFGAGSNVFDNVDVATLVDNSVSMNQLFVNSQVQ